MNEAQLKALLLADDDIYQILSIIRGLKLSDTWLCAGTLRNFVWNHLSGKSAFDKETDVDVIFFDQTLSYEETLAIEKSLQTAYPAYRWELKNQAHMHCHSPNTKPYLNSCDAVSKYPERCTALSARLNHDGNLELFLPYGLEEVTQLTVRPTPHFLEDEERMALYHQRIAKKNWQEKWPQLKVVSQ